MGNRSRPSRPAVFASGARDFWVEISPAVPRAKLLAWPPTLAELQALYPHVDHVWPLYDVTYHVAGQVFGYHPSNIYTSLIDLTEEWMSALARQPHNVSPSGYDVLGLHYQEDTAQFCAPADFSSGTPAPWSPIGAPVRADEVEQVFAAATSALWKAANRR